MNRKILGIDIRLNEISAVLVENDAKENIVREFIHIPMEIDPEGGHIYHALETLSQSMDITDSICIVSLPADEVSYRNLHVPFRDRKKIRQILPFELETNLPYPVNALELDFQILTSLNEDDGALLLAAAVERERLEFYKEALSSINIDPQFIVVGGFQTAACVAEIAGASTDTLFIDIDPRKSTVFAISSGEIRLIRTFAINASSKQPGKSLCSKLSQTISGSEEILGPDFEPRVIYLTGSGLREYPYHTDIEALLQVPVRSLNLLKNMNTPITGFPDASFPDASWEPDLMDNAMALCLSEITGVKGFNFSKRMFAIKKFWMANKVNVIKTSAMAGVILFLVLVNLFYDYHAMGKKIDALDAQIVAVYQSTFPASNAGDPNRLRDRMAAEVKAARESSSATEETEREVKAIDILYDVSTLLPDKIDVEIKNFVIGPDNVQITGDTDTFNSVDDMKNRLEKSKNFKKVTISSSKKDIKENRINFKLKIDL